MDTLICGGIGGGAQAALAEAGIKLYGGVSGDCLLYTSFQRRFAVHQLDRAVQKLADIVDTSPYLRYAAVYAAPVSYTHLLAKRIWVKYAMPTSGVISS